ncbi:MAG TPA: zinc-binding alcohol dehydrogenase family protein [Bryobacteraceae bacterium]|jgi:threonine dehydrogenase-like Zn-dependent dehydrogenase
MKALIIQKPGEITVGGAAEPGSRHGEVLLRVRMIGLCGSDLNTYRGKNPMVSFPRIPGHEIAATVEEVQDPASELRPGMNVTLSPYTSCGQCASCLRGRFNACKSNQTLGVQRDGALTDLISVPAAKIFPAEGLNLEELCIVEPLTVGFHAVARGRVTNKDTVAIFGCGGVGLGAIAASAFRNAKTIAVDVDDAKLQIARQAGAHHTINTRTEPLHDKLLELSEGLGPDVVIEAIGLPATFTSAVEEVAFTGRVVYIGYAKDLVTYETRLFVQKELDILGSRNALPEDFGEVIRMLQQHRFPVKSAITKVVPFDQAPAAFVDWSENPAGISKIMIRVN